MFVRMTASYSLVKTYACLFGEANYLSYIYTVNDEKKRTYNKKTSAKQLGEARECSYIYRVNNDKNKQKPN